MRFLSFVALAIVASSCGVSPLLNHVDADAMNRADERAAVPGCDFRFARAGLCASLTWDVRAGEDPGEFTLRFWNPDRSTSAGPYVDPAPTVAVKLWMPSMNHGSSPVTVTRQADGVYRATGVYFVMPGEWEIRAQLKQGTTMLEQVALGIRI